MRKPIFPLLIIVISILFIPNLITTRARELNSASEVISQINAYRSQKGLYSYQSNSILMAAAQNHSNYQASIGSITHTGAGGTRPIDRAYAASYGDGNKIFISEIIYGGTNASVSDAITWWKGSAIHNDQMLANTYQEIGAGVATDGTWIYYTAVMGWVTGVDAPSDSDDGGSSGGGVTIPVVISTPNADGSVVHIVQTGQTQFGIAFAYNIPVSQLYELNDLNEFSYIYPGDELLIKSAEVESSATPTKSPEPTITPTSTVTPAPTATASPTSANLTGAAGIADDNNDPASTQNTLSSPFRWGIIALIAGIFIIISIGFIIPKTKIDRE